MFCLPSTTSAVHFPWPTHTRTRLATRALRVCGWALPHSGTDTDLAPGVGLDSVRRPRRREFRKALHPGSRPRREASDGSPTSLRGWSPGPTAHVCRDPSIGALMLGRGSAALDAATPDGSHRPAALSGPTPCGHADGKPQVPRRGGVFEGRDRGERSAAAFDSTGKRRRPIRPPASIWPSRPKALGHAPNERWTLEANRKCPERDGVRGVVRATGSQRTRGPRSEAAAGAAPNSAEAPGDSLPCSYSESPSDVRLTWSRWRRRPTVDFTSIVRPSYSTVSPVAGIRPSIW